MSNLFILDAEGCVQPVSDVLTWVRWFENDKHRFLARDFVGDIEISTVFLGVDQRFGAGPPLIFETMMWGGKDGERTWKYSTKEEALEGHRRVVEAARQEVA